MIGLRYVRIPSGLPGSGKLKGRMRPAAIISSTLEMVVAIDPSDATDMPSRLSAIEFTCNREGMRLTAHIGIFGASGGARTFDILPPDLNDMEPMDSATDGLRDIAGVEGTDDGSCAARDAQSPCEAGSRRAGWLPYEAGGAHR